MPLGDISLKDKVVVVTGGATGKKKACFASTEVDLTMIGIGLAFCITCLALGAKTIIADLSIRPGIQDLLDKHKLTMQRPKMARSPTPPKLLKTPRGQRWYL